MDFLLWFLFASVFFGAGYGFRGLIGRELRKISAELKADLARVDAAVKTKL